MHKLALKTDRLLRGCKTFLFNLGFLAGNLDLYQFVRRTAPVRLLRFRLQMGDKKSASSGPLYSFRKKGDNPASASAHRLHFTILQPLLFCSCYPFWNKKTLL